MPDGPHGWNSTQWDLEPVYTMLEGRVRRYAVSKYTDDRADRRIEGLFITLLGPFHEIYLGGKIFIMLYVDRFNR